ncbi:MAG: PEP-CTERM sorting domain-containing protein [Thermoguttaceae bacterium]|nr:PEP-CTERM sorting domain-containing protein [Thermoguttaceae bacterium]
MRQFKKYSLWALAVLSALLAGNASAADVTLNSTYNTSGYSWGVAGETLNVTLDSADKFAGTLTITDGTAKFASNYATSTLGSGAKIVLGAGTTLNINGMYLNPASISTTGAATITSSVQNTQNGVYTISSLGGDLTIDTPTRYCITGAVDASGYEIYKTGTSEMVVKSNISNLKALHINAGTWAVEANVTGFGTGDIYLESGGKMKLWGTGRDVTFSTLHHKGGTIDWYSDGSGAQAITGNISLEVDSAAFRVSSTLTFTGSISGEGKTLVHSGIVSTATNGDGKPQTGHWIFKGTSAEAKGVTKVANFNLSTKDSEIILGDYSEWNISNAVTGQSTGHILTVGPNASLTAASISGIQTLTLNGTTALGAITMNQPDGSLTIGTATEVGALSFTQNTALETNANLSTTDATSIAEGVTVTKSGAGTFILGGNLTGKGNLIVQAGTLTQTTGSSKFNSFTGQITLGSGATFDLNGQQAYECPAIICEDGSSVVNKVSSSAVNWQGANLKIADGANVTIGGNQRMGVKFDGGNGNGGTINVTNSNYVFMNTKLENATVNVTGVLGLEAATTLTGSAGKEVYLNFNGGKLNSWTGTGTYTLNPTTTTVQSGGATFCGSGNMIMKNPVTLEGTLNLNLPQFTSTNIYLATFRFDGEVSGDQEIVSGGEGIATFNAGADVSKLTLNNGGIVIKDGTFEADEFAINKSYEVKELSGGSWERGLIVDGGTLVSNESFTSSGQTVVMKSGAMSLGGTVTDDAASGWKIDGGTLTLDDGVTLNGKVEMDEDATLVVGTDSTKASTIQILSNESILNGSFLFDVFADGSSDEVILGSGTKLENASITLNLSEGTNPNDLELVKLFQSGDLANALISITNPGWNYLLQDGGLYAQYNSGAIPEPATWVLLVLGLGLFRLRKKNA